jgi:hypothetical protein
MKKIIIGAFILSIFGCSPEEIQKEIKEIKDCNCNRITEVLTLNIVEAYPKTGVTIMYRYTTINDCTKLQKNSGWSTQKVLIGQCK